MHTVFALLCFVVVIHWLIFPYPSGLLHWHCGNLTIAPVPAKQPWWIWRITSYEFIMNDCITTTKQSTTKPCAYFLGYTVSMLVVSIELEVIMKMCRRNGPRPGLIKKCTVNLFIQLCYIIVGSEKIISGGCVACYQHTIMNCGNKTASKFGTIDPAKCHEILLYLVRWQRAHIISLTFRFNISALC